MLKVQDLVTAYGKIEALKGVSLEVKPGSITCLLGPNGAGKTTLMMTIAGILKPRSGSIRFSEKEITALPAHAIVASGIALVPENRLVFPSMTVLENLHAGAYQRRNGFEADIERLFARFPPLKERSAQLAGTLSGGEQQMLALARALMSRPRLLLLDEPSLGLAPLVTREIFRIVSELNEKEGLTVLVVEQNAAIALEVASYAYVLEVGKVAVSGPSEELARNETVRKSYLGY